MTILDMLAVALIGVASLAMWATGEMKTTDFFKITLLAIIAMHVIEA